MKGQKNRRWRRLKRRIEKFFITILSILLAVTLAAVVVVGLRAHDQWDTVAQTAPLNLSAAAPKPTASATPRVVKLEPTATPAPTATAAPTATPVPTATPTPEPTATPEPTPTPTPEPRSVTFRVTGDIMASETMLKYAKKAGGGDGYDYGPQFALIAEELSNADYTMGNLETTIGKYKELAYSGYPMFNTPESYLETLKEVGYDFLTLANNHMLDRYFDGMKNTIANVESYGFDHCGAYATQEDRQSANIKEIGGIRFGFLSYTQGANGVETYSDPAAEEFGVPFLFEAAIESDVKRLREAGAEIIIVFPHWGDEYLRKPNETQRKYARRFADAGVDIIIGSHPHVLQKVEWLEADDKKVLTAYSMGNFISTQKHHGYTDTGMILEFTVKDTPDGKLEIGDLGYVPVYVWWENNKLQVVNSAKHYDSKPDGMSKSAYNRMKESYRQTRELIDESIPVLEN